ncbi:hypothetical protein MPS_3945 [Mycobacterium pseudoshottsii JCM 15466]|nr:hypothetical protein MPS_3945 [Mycobacterium pseudoshottsii JCM 15466]
MAVPLPAANWCNRIRSTKTGRGFTTVISRSARDLKWLAAMIPA